MFCVRVPARIFALCLAAWFFAGAVQPAAAENAEPIRLEADFWFPYNGEPGSAEEGFAVDLAREIFRRTLGREVDYSLAPWLRAIEDARVGETHGVIAASREEVPEFVFPREHLGRVTMAIFTTGDFAWDYQGVGSLAEVRLGVISGYDYGPEVNAHLRQHAGNLEKVDFSGGENAFSKNVEKLCQGSVDAIVESETVFFAQIARMGLDQNEFRKVAELGDPYAVYVAFSPEREESAQLAAAWDRGMAELRASGDLEKILTRYGLQESKIRLREEEAPPTASSLSASPSPN